MMIGKFLVFAVLLLGFLLIGYTVGICRGYRHGFSEGVEHQELKAIEKLEPKGDEKGDR